MASTRYGRIYHSDHHHNNIKFPSPAAREKFAQEFKKYHESHDHDGEVPRFEMIKAADLRSYEWQSHDADEVTIDGYTWYEIKKYHQREHRGRHTHYHPPTCCVSPIIVLEREFIDSGRLERHELSSIFGDMPDDDFQSLMESVKADGFMDYVIRMHEEKILDGWHRYRAALELNLVRKLRFVSWDAEKEGGAVAFVAARNIERRHLSASQRAQIVVSLHERFGWGGDRSKMPNGILKTQKDLAKQAKVGERTISRAIAVEKAGKSDEVIAGEKSATQVIIEENVKDLWQKVSDEIPKWRQRYKESGRREIHYVSRASKSMLIQALRAYHQKDTEGAATVEELKALLKVMQQDSFPFVFHLRKIMKGSEKQTAETSEAETPNPSAEISLPGLRKTWHSVRDAMFDAFQASDLTPEISDPKAEESPYKRALRAFCDEVESKYPGMDVYSHPSYEGFYSSPNQLRAYEREIEIYKQLTADIQAKADWVVHILNAVPEQPAPEPETEDDTPSIDTSDVTGCRNELRRIIQHQGELNKGNMDYPDLCFRFKLSKEQVKEIGDAVRKAAYTSATDRHNECRDQITDLWLNNGNLSDEIGLDALHKKLVEIFDLREMAFEKKFHGLSLREIQEEAKTLWEIYNALTAPESELLKKLLGKKTIVDVLITYADDDGEVFQSWYTREEGNGKPIEELPLVVRIALENMSKLAEPFEVGKA